MYIDDDIMVVTVNWANVPCGVTSKEPPPNKGVPEKSLQDPTTNLETGTN